MTRESCMYVPHTTWVLMPDGTNRTVDGGSYLDPKVHAAHVHSAYLDGLYYL